MGAASTATNWVSVLSRVFDFSALQILPLVPGLCANRATTVFTQRRIRAVFAAIAARASRLRILVVRQSLPSKPNSRWANETDNERHWKDGRLLHRTSMWADANPRRCRCSEEQKEALTIWKPRFGTSAMFKRIKTWQTRTK